MADGPAYRNERSWNCFWHMVDARDYSFCGDSNYLRRAEFLVFNIADDIRHLASDGGLPGAEQGVSQLSYAGN